MNKRFMIFILSMFIGVLSIASVGMLTATTADGYNRSIFDTTWNFDTAVIQRYDGEQVIKVSKWCDYENSDMIQVTAEDGTVYLTHSSNVILIKSK